MSLKVLMNVIIYMCFFLIRLILFKKEFEILRTHVEIDLEIKSHY